MIEPHPSIKFSEGRSVTNAIVVVDQATAPTA